ncbi:chaperone protein [Vibrio phage vB_VcorM_GR7B]|nr:chaperone protein [Vibrio phage vB_VcorM_GR7B]
MSNQQQRRDPFKILGITDPSTVTKESLKKAYRRLANQYHPDKLVGARSELREDAEKKMADLNWAMEELEDETKWAFYSTPESDREALANLEALFVQAMNELNVNDTRDVFEVMSSCMERNLNSLYQAKRKEYRSNIKYNKALRKIKVDTTKASAFVYLNVLKVKRQETVNNWYRMRHEAKVLNRVLELLEGNELRMRDADTEGGWFTTSTNSATSYLNTL